MQIRSACLLLLMLGSRHAAAAPEETVVVKLSREQGVHTCLPAVKKVSEFLVGDSRNGAYVTSPKGKADDSYVTATIERDYSDAATISSMTVMRTRSNQCAAVYEQIYTLDKPCLAAAGDEFKAFRPKGMLSKSVAVYANPDDSIELYLLDVRGTCLAVKKESLNNVREP